jgi:lysozyme
MKFNRKDTMRASAKVYERLRDREELRLEAYPDQAGVWTLGYGETKGIKAGMTCTKEQAEEWLAKSVKIAESAAFRPFRNLTVNLTQNQFDALVHFAYNTGVVGETMAMRIYEGDFAAAATEFKRWVYVRNRVTGKRDVSNGLVARRTEEAEWFLTPDSTEKTQQPLEASV